jgi:hypothetical protein
MTTLPFSETKYGFKWGPVEVSRLHDHGGKVWLEFTTRSGKWEMSVSPGGERVMFHRKTKASERT